MSTLGWIIGIAVVIVIQCTKWSNLSKLIASFIVGPICFFIFPSNSFTGNIQEDAKIVYERIYEDGEDVDKVTNELAEYYVDKGYGMNNAKQVLIIVSDMYSNSSN